MNIFNGLIIYPFESENSDTLEAKFANDVICSALNFPSFKQVISSSYSHVETVVLLRSNNLALFYRDLCNHVIVQLCIIIRLAC